MKKNYPAKAKTIKAKILFTVLTIAIFSFFHLPAQTTFTIGGTGVAVNGPFDIADANYVATGDIYLSTEIATSGTITTLEWNNFSCPVITLPAVKIYMKLIPTGTTTWPTETYLTAINGATLVYSGSYSSTTNGYANPVTLQTPFFYSSADNLEIITESDYGSTNQNEPSWYYNSNVANSDASWYASTNGGLPGASNTTGGIDKYRPDVKITLLPCTTAPTITLGNNPSVCSSPAAQTASLSYSATTGTPTTYSISGWSGGGFAAVTNVTLPANTISIPVPAGIAAGTYTATLTVENACDSTSPNYSISIAVKQSPTATANSNSPICVGQALTLTGGSDSTTSYAWSSSPSGFSSSIQSPTVSSSATTGMAGVYTVTVTAGNNCTATAATTVTINLAPATPGAITGAANICNASINTYSVATVTGATSYTWTLPNGWTGTSSTNSISATQGTGGGTISVTANNTCGNSVAQTLVVTVTAIPSTPGTISGPDSVCSNVVNTFSVATISGATFYTWTLPNGWTGSSTTNSINATADANAGNILVSAGNTCGSSSNATLAVSIIAPVTMPNAIIGPASLCSSAIDTYSVVSVSGATSYTWTLPAGWAGTSSTDSIKTTAGAGGGTISVTANNVCGSSNAQTLAITVSSAPATPGPIIGPTTLCNTSVDTFSVAPVSGATSYTWTLPNGWTGSSVTDSIGVTTNTTGGTVSVIANNGCGSSTAQTLAVNTSAIPAEPGSIAGPTSACNGDANVFSVATVNGATSYTWTLPNGWTGSSTSNSISATAGVNSGTVSVTANNGCGSSAAQTLTVTLGSTPATPGTITGPGSACNGDVANYSIAAVNGATSYTWTLPNGWTGSSTTNSINATAGANAGTVSVTANNGCGSSAAQTLTVTLGSTPATPGTITGPGSACNGDVANYSIAAVNGATSYTWTLPNGWTGSSTTNSINATAGANAGTVSVTANNGCGSSAAQTLTVTAGSTPATPGTITGPVSACNGDADTFSIVAVTGATSYTWTLPNGFTGSSTTTSINTVAGANAGVVLVTANNGCGSSAAQTLTVTAGSTPATPGTITGPSVVCNGISNTYSVVPISGATSYTWTLPNGWTGTSSTDNINTTAASAGTISVTANNGCGTSPAQTLIVTLGSTPATPTAIFGPDSVCNGSSAIYSVVSVTGASSYTWTLPSGWAGTSTADSINATGATGNGAITVTADNGCGSSSAQIKIVTLNPVPTVAYSFADNPVCNNVNPIVNLTGGTPTGGVYTGQGISGTIFDASSLSVGNYVITYTYTSQLGCIGSDTSTVIVTVCSGIENTADAQITVYPNPFNDALIIHTNSNLGKGTAMLMDATGRIVSRTEFESGATSVQLNTSALANGAYLLDIFVKGKSVAIKKVFRIE